MLACLAALPPENIVFETDAPSQPFAVESAYADWADDVFGPAPVAAPRRAETHAGGAASGAKPANSPAYLVHIVRAAAVWRCVHLLGGSAAPAGDGDVAESTPPGWPSRAAARAEYEVLARCSTDNVLRMFQAA